MTPADAGWLGGDERRILAAQAIRAAAYGFGAVQLGVLAIGEGGLDVETDDQRLLERGRLVYDTLYAWCQQQTRLASP